MTVSVLVYCVGALLIHLSASKHLEPAALQRSNTNLVCNKEHLEADGYSIESCTTFTNNPDHGEVCFVHTSAENEVTDVRVCNTGDWFRPDAPIEQPHFRHKRFWFFVGALVGVIGCRKCWWCSCGGGTQVITKTPPKFTANCPPSDLRSEYVASPGTEAAIVTWTDPTASDTDGSVNSVQQVFGPAKGGSFEGSPGQGRQHGIVYEATDNDGLKASCYFSVTVKVETCSALPWPTNGHRDCPNDNILGSTCTYGCNTGYQLTSNVNTVTCQSTSNGPSWSTIPTCEKVTCGRPPDVPDGDLTCTDPYHSYSSYCSVECNPGFKLSGQVFTRCEADTSWFWVAPSTCVDDTPPELTCSSPQVFYADRGSTSTSVYWQLPTATDTLDPSPTVTQTSGPTLGVSVEAGTSQFVQYKAVDAVGNESPQCTIELRVLEVSCGHPTDTLEDNDLLFNCTTGTYTHGDMCTLACDLNLPLEGTDLITCEANITFGDEPTGYWDWGSGDMPKCRDIACPDISPPLNGAMVLTSSGSRPFYTMVCNAAWDIPDEGTNFNGIFICQDSGDWVPNYLKAPDCIEIFTSRGFRLPSELFYYSGTCGVDDNIRTQFQAIVDDLNNIFPPLCPIGTVCSVTELKITCGPLSGRRKRRSMTKRSTRYGLGDIHSIERRQASGDVLVVEFYIETTGFNFTGMSNNEIFTYVDDIQLNILKPKVQEKFDNGELDLPGWTLTNDSFRTAAYGNWFCDAGLVRSGNSEVCKPCALGRYETGGECALCPVGEYSNTSGAVTCTKCPDGYSTRHVASEYIENCTKLCSPGHYSPDTFVPCAQCKIGFYQNQTGQTSCMACPAGTTTTTTGSTAQTDCHNFDVLLNNTAGEVSVTEIAILNDVTIMFWTKSVPSGVPRGVITVRDALDIVIADQITVNVNLQSPTTFNIGPSSSTAWIHVAVTLDATNSLLTAYRNGVKVIDQQAVPAASSPLLQNGQLTVANDGEAGVWVADVSVQGAVIGDSDVTQASGACHLIVPNAVVNMDAFKNISQQGVSIITPSACDAMDECAASPCGTHKCINEVGGFICICSNGWSGTTCNTPPNYCLSNDCSNGATCVNGQTDYTCTCQPGYTGVFCEIPPVDGAWSDWSAWTECSVTCGGGSQSRSRACDSPAPDTYGQNCTGEDTQIQNCKTDTCPECPVLVRGFGSILNCNDSSTTGSTTCILTCKPGYTLPSGLQRKTYTCGVATDHAWRPFSKVPDCKQPDRASRYDVVSTATYNTPIPASDMQAVEIAVRANVQNTDCFNALTCNVSVSINNQRRRKRQTTGSTVTVAFTITLTDTSDLQLEDFSTNGTVSPALQEVIDAINNLESTATAINTSANAMFDVTVNGATYTVDPSSLAFTGSATCPTGQVVTDALCVECPTGTYLNVDVCSYCEKGTYQDLSGQTSCTSCPTGFTTVTIGADASSDCSVPENSTSASNSSTAASTSSTSTITTATTTTTTTTSASPGRHDEETDESSTIGMYVGVTFAMLSLVISGVTVLMLCLKKHNSNLAKVRDSSADLRGSESNLSRAIRIHQPPIPAPIRCGEMPIKTSFQRGTTCLSLSDVDLNTKSRPSSSASHNIPAISSPECCSDLYD